MSEAMTVSVPADEAGRISKFENWAKSLTIKSGEEHDYALQTLKAAKTLKNNIVAFFADTKENAHKTWKGIVAQEKRFTDQIDAGERAAKAAILKYQQEQEALRVAEQRRLQAEADARAAAERARLEKEAAKLKTPELREARLEAAAQVIAPVVHVAPIVETTGSSIRRTWKARVVDVSLVPREYMVVNEVALQGFARATKGQVKIAGVEFYEDAGLSVRV